jgi:hypothetical protein
LQPTQQTVIPVVLWNGVINPGTPVAVTLNPDYDHVVSLLALADDDEAGAGTFTMSDSDGNPLKEWQYGMTTGGDPWNFEGCAGLVLQSLSGLVLVSDADNLVGSLSAYRLNPSATLIFS